MVAPAGIGPWPQITSDFLRRVSCRIIGTSPPGPFKCGSTACKVKAVATAASKALPPFSRMLMPTAVAIQWVDATTPKVPTISGRVVKGLGLIRDKGRSPATLARGDLKPSGSGPPEAVDQAADQASVVSGSRIQAGISGTIRA